MLRKTKIGWGALIGYVVAAVSSPFVPEFVSWAIPAVTTLVAGMLPSAAPRSRSASQDAARLNDDRHGNRANQKNLQDWQPGGSTDNGERQRSPQGQTGDGQQTAASVRFGQETAVQDQGAAEISKLDPVFGPVIEYLEVLEDMVISEGQKNELDNEIVEKSLALFARLQRVIPALNELNNGDINHMVRRLILKDLNGLINPFLRLSGDAKRTNRRTLLGGLKDVDSKISEIVSTIEHKDLMELQNKAELIHQRYNGSEL